MPIFHVRSPKPHQTHKPTIGTFADHTELTLLVGVGYHFQRPERTSEELKIWEA